MADAIPQRWYTVAQVANLIGSGRTRITRARDAGELRFTMRKRRLGSVFQVRRDDLIAWLVKNDFPLDEFRYKFAAGEHVLACGLATPQMAALAGWRVEFAATATRLGQLLATKPSWAVVVSFDRLGREQALDVAADLRRDLGRPYLVGLVGEDEATRPGRAADVYDVLFSADIAPSKLKAAMKRLRRCGDRGSK